MAKLGRKPLPAAQRKTKPFQLKLSKAEMGDVQRAAALDADKPYVWGRRMVVLAARERISRGAGAR